MIRLTDIFLDLVSFDTQSSEKTGTHPSTPGQTRLAVHLAEILKETGLQNVRQTEHGYVLAELPASSGCEHAPALGWIAHIDTSDAASGKDVRPRILTYDGTPIPLGNGRELIPEKGFIGDELIVTDGTTLLGADDKAGIAEIITAMDTIISEKRPHGKLCIAFTPDEEIGEGTLFFDVPSFGAKFAFTMDGGNIQEIGYSNFNAAAASVTITGRSTHPGSAKGTMLNAIRIAYEFDSVLPEMERPENTEGKEGFFHPYELHGTVGHAEMHYIIRDHDASAFEQKKNQILSAAEKMNQKYGPGTIKAEIKEQYRNMEEVIAGYPDLIETAKAAVFKVTGTQAIPDPIRGGTDGSKLSFAGLPCPNLGTGGRCAHGETEHVSLREMTLAVQIILQIIDLFSGKMII